MTSLNLPTDLIFWLFVPGLLACLVFSWLIYLSRDRRHSVVRIRGLGISLSISSTDQGDSKELIDAS